MKDRGVSDKFYPFFRNLGGTKANIYGAIKWFWSRLPRKDMYKKYWEKEEKRTK